MPQSQYWFVPGPFPASQPDELDSESSGELQLANSMGGNRQPVCAGSAFTLVLRSFYVTEDVDANSNNDLLVRSWSKYGNQPQIEAIHFLAKDVPEKRVIKGEQIMANHLLSAKNHQDENLIWLKLEIVDIKGEEISGKLGDIRQSFEKINHEFGAVFPGLKSLVRPFSTAGNMAASAEEVFSRVRDVIGTKKKRTIFSVALDLCCVDSGETPFCYGTYIIFDRAVEGSQYRLQDNALEPIVHNSPPQYMMFEVLPDMANTQIGEDILLNQHLAAGSLLLDSDGHTNPKQIKRFEHLQGLMKKAIQLDELLEYKQLFSKQTELTQEEQKRVKVLVSKLGRYIKVFDDMA